MGVERRFTHTKGRVTFRNAKNKTSRKRSEDKGGQRSAGFNSYTLTTFKDLSLTLQDVSKMGKAITKVSPKYFREDDLNLVKKTKGSLWRAFVRSVMAIRKKVMKRVLLSRRI